ncbi:DUF4389 domain-containing protein [Pseudarthrobacter sp. PH31-O2]|uniref:DUF4389 domain-containing protein n=1 Tax=Pseudarthrobacter sp. PH31-O2 TaxID=3046206 RepID=UPI0024BAA578|nr:DUF4389 domain-containing protein [Pseudarthrobacter sp. PH31-O2]MDJ0354220.1 DUF4389 domain-containing protein [Pseudarthrobacter sp. PH31-O2]
MRPGRIVMLVLGTLSALLGLGLLAGAGAAGFGNYVQRDNGYFTTPSERYATSGYALTTPRLDIMTERGVPDAVPVGVVGSLMLSGSGESGKDIFIGVGPRSDVAAYLDGVSHAEITDVRFNPFRVEYRSVAGANVPARPADQSFWAASATGAGEQQLEWDLRSGSWAVVIMNADASPPTAVELKAGARSELLWPVFVGLLIGGVVFLLIGIPLIVLGAAGLGRGGPPPMPGQSWAVAGAAAPQFPAAGAAAGAPPGSAAVYPARLSGYLDPKLSRWLWLFKWFLAIPHFIVLFFLWFAFGVVTIVAWFAILFTGRYPRSLFNFNVGVLRWSWRVAFYSYAALGTDIYPPFTLARTDYPADFDVDYPEKLSRGLVLVKSWLLAIPHLLIVALLTGTAQTWVYRDGRWAQVGVGVSLLGLLVLIAGVVLLFTGAYARGLFDFLLGLNRWIYRVWAYVSLMRDEYPPFHLDSGPRDPGDTAAIPPAWSPAGPGAPGGGPAGPGAPGGDPAGPTNARPTNGGPGFYGIGGPAARGPEKRETPAGPEAAAGPTVPASQDNRPSH